MISCLCLWFLICANVSRFPAGLVQLFIMVFLLPTQRRAEEQTKWIFPTGKNPSILIQYYSFKFKQTRDKIVQVNFKIPKPWAGPLIYQRDRCLSRYDKCASFFCRFRSILEWCIHVQYLFTLRWCLNYSHNLHQYFCTETDRKSGQWERDECMTARAGTMDCVLCSTASLSFSDTPKKLCHSQVLFHSL